MSPPLFHTYTNTLVPMNILCTLAFVTQFSTEELPQHLKKFIENGLQEWKENLCKVTVKHLTTHDAISCHLTHVPCYQLAQSILKIGFVLAKKWDRERWVSIVATCYAIGGCLGWF